jgi:hypothetical protein
VISVADKIVKHLWIIFVVLPLFIGLIPLVIYASGR